MQLQDQGLRDQDARSIRAELAQRLAGTNINATSFLATDYLNHFNEAVMLLELIGNDPTLLPELRLWAPKSYTEHFEMSGFETRALACLAYRLAPENYRMPFDLTIRAANRSIIRAIDDVGRLVDSGADSDSLAQICRRRVDAVKNLITVAGAIINGQAMLVRDRKVMAKQAADKATMGQADIDALFG